jgi:hypothetical protein
VIGGLSAKQKTFLIGFSAGDERGLTEVVWMFARE